MKKSSKHYICYGKCYCDCIVVALEEVGFLILEKPKCLLVNQIGDNIPTFVNQPSACAP
jgi:hypothetical protein